MNAGGKRKKKRRRASPEEEERLRRRSEEGLQVLEQEEEVVVEEDGDGGDDGRKRDCSSGFADSLDGSGAANEEESDEEKRKGVGEAGEENGDPESKSNRRLAELKRLSRFDNAQVFARECRKALKKARDFHVRKIHRKVKKGEGDPEKLQRDLEIVKSLNVDSLVGAVDAIRKGEKPNVDRREEERRFQLIQLILHCTTVRKWLGEYELKLKRKRRRVERKKKTEAKRAHLLKQKKLGKARSDPFAKSSSEANPLKGLRVGQKLRGIVDGSESYGVFVKFLHKKNVVSGLCHISELADKFVKNPAKEFPPGTWVNARILKLDPRNERVSVTFKGLNVDDQTVRAKLDGETSKKGNGSRGLTSEFVSSLGEPQRPNSTSSKDTRHRTREVVSLLKELRDLKGSKNRLGQRQRKKLKEKLYGYQTEEKSAVASDRANNGASIDKGKAPRRRKRQKLENKAEEKPGNVRSMKKTASKSRSKDTDQAQDGDAALHPSWAAKRAKSAAVKFQGTKITFD